jgi:hypothetical protein
MADGPEEPTQIENDTPPTPPAEPTPTTPPEAPPPAPKTFDESYVLDLRAEARKNRLDLKAAEGKLRKLEEAQIATETAELEAQGKWKELAEQNVAKTADLESQLAEREAALQTERRNTLAVSVATQLGAIDPTDANVQTAVVAIDIAVDDAEAQIRQALEALKASRPYLFGTGKPNLAPFNPSGQPQPEPKETPAQQRERIRGGGGKSFFDTTVYKPEFGEEIVKGG